MLSTPPRSLQRPQRRAAGMSRSGESSAGAVARGPRASSATRIQRDPGSCPTPSRAIATEGAGPAARSGPLATAALLAAPGRRGDAPWRWLPHVVVEGLEWQPSVVVAAANEVSRVARSALFATPVTSPALRSGGGPPGRHALHPPGASNDHSEEPLGCPGVANQAQAPSPAGPAPRLAPGPSVTPALALHQAEPSPRREQPSGS